MIRILHIIHSNFGCIWCVHYTKPKRNTWILVGFIFLTTWAKVNKSKWTPLTWSVPAIYEDPGAYFFWFLKKTCSSTAIFKSHPAWSNFLMIVIYFVQTSTAFTASLMLIWYVKLKWDIEEERVNKFVITLVKEIQTHSLLNFFEEYFFDF